MKMNNKFREWDNEDRCGAGLVLTFDNGGDENRTFKDLVGSSCAICKKQDYEILTLQQCIGCKTSCYCSDKCQTVHWIEHGHRVECKQTNILEKYHKPYAKIIRDAAIRGDTVIPELQKLRYKLGLDRPDKDHEELAPPGLNPLGYRVARDDGTVWIGSNRLASVFNPASTFIWRNITIIKG
jgi:hypothetical protein